MLNSWAGPEVFGQTSAIAYLSFTLKGRWRSPKRQHTLLWLLGVALTYFGPIAAAVCAVVGLGFFIAAQLDKGEADSDSIVSLNLGDSAMPSALLPPMGVSSVIVTQIEHDEGAGILPKTAIVLKNVGKETLQNVGLKTFALSGKEIVFTRILGSGIVLL